MSTLKRDPAESPYSVQDESAYDLELISLSSADYVPAVAARGFIICGATGAVKIDTPAGNTVTIPSGLAAGIVHPIRFTKMYSGTTTATSLVALG